jgi:mRNA interferase YafQ
VIKPRYSAKFRKDYKTVKKRGYDVSELKKTVDMLCRQIPLPESMQDHPLSGNRKGYRECHIRPDWLLIYKLEKDKATLTAARTGTHSELFG